MKVVPLIGVSAWGQVEKPDILHEDEYITINLTMIHTQIATTLFLLMIARPARADLNADLVKAAYSDNTSAVKTLLNKGAYINTKSNYTWTALMYASSRGNIATVKILLDRGADIEAKGRNGYTALMLATLSGHIRVVRALLNKGAKVNAKANNGYTALRLAKEEKNKRLFILLKKAKAGYFNSSSITAVIEKPKGYSSIDIQNRPREAPNFKVESDPKRKEIWHEEKSKGYQSIDTQKKVKTEVVTLKTSLSETTYNGWFYLGNFESDKRKWVRKTINGYEDKIPEAGGKVTLNIPMYLRDDRPHVSIHKNARLVPPYTIPTGVELTVKNIDSETGLGNIWVEVQFSHDDMNKLAKKARQIDLDFLVAVKKGNTEEISALLGKNPNINARYKNGMTPLILAAKKGYVEIAQIILDKGAEVNAEANDGWTALMTAAWKGRTTIVKTLLDKGAKINKKSNNRWTALLAASKYGYFNIVRMLMKQGADVTAKNRNGKTSLMLAAARDHSKIAEYLKQAGAR